MTMGIIPDPVVKLVTPIVASTSKYVLGEVVGDSEEVRRLSGTLDREVKQLLKNCEELELTPEFPVEHIHPYSPLMKELAEFCYDVSDVQADVYLTEMKRPNFCQLTTFDHIIRFFTPNIAKEVIALWSLTSNPKLINRMKELAEIRMLNLKQQVEHHPLTKSNQKDNDNGQELTDSLPLPYGRKEDERVIIEKLLGDDSNYGISLIGMGGLGKTMLARSIVEDQRVKDKFSVIKWVTKLCFRKKSDPIILYSSQPGETPPSTSCEVNTKTLLVLDDLETNPTAYISNHVKEGKVVFLITTRDPMVSIKSTPIVRHYLKRISDQDCEELIKIEVKAAKLSDDDQVFFETRAIQLAMKCMGFPLMATTVGREICARARCTTNDVKDEFKHFEASKLWEMLGAKIISKLSFNDKQLASHLNKLAYFTLFPHDHSFNKDGLILLWIAEGFIQPVDSDWESKLRHFDKMLPISMIEPSEMDAGYPSCYQTNEIAHHIAKSIYGNIFFRMDIGGDTSYDSNARHLSLCLQEIPDIIFDKIAQNVSRLRTFLLLRKSGTNITQVPRSLLEKSSVLRVLNLSQSSIEIVPKSIGKLKHLRYLDLSFTPIKNLPDSICKLVFLITLKLIMCKELISLPKKIGKLINLTHLELEISCTLPKSLGKLKRLQCFRVFSVEKNPEDCRITELRELNLIRGSLRIRNLENVTCGEEASEAALDRKEDLKTLFLEWGHSSTDSTLEVQAAQLQMLTNLTPHSSLSELRVTNYGGNKLPGWICSLTCVTTIHLYNFPYVSELPNFWQLPYLNTLRIEDLSGVQSMGRQFFGDQANYRFQSLKCLEVFNMKILDSFVGLEPGDMPYLSTLKFENCPKLAEISTLRDLLKLTSLSISNCPGLSSYAPEIIPTAVYHFC